MRRDYQVSIEVSYDDGATWVIEEIRVTADNRDAAQELVVDTVDMTCVHSRMEGVAMCHRHVLRVECAD